MTRSELKFSLAGPTLPHTATAAEVRVNVQMDAVGHARDGQRSREACTGTGAQRIRNR
jgi:hypothetical protein